MNEAPKPSYAWPRFWVPRSGVIDLSDGGFFVDPMGQYAPWSVGRRLSELSAYRALALLGEPGIGKSTTLQAEAERLRTQQDVASIHVDLRAFSSEALLYKKLFESETFTAWVNGTANLILQLDSLDEALLRIDSIGSLLADELPNYPTARLSIRIACRTAVWPSSTLEPSLNRIWGEAAVGFYELAPLRRKDVVHAAEARGINADSFFREVYASNVVPFAIKPLTLNMLLNLFQKDGKLPRNVAEIYSRGCLAFCEELNPSRRDAGRFGSFTAAQKLRVASRVAAATMFANRYAVWTGPLGENVPDEDVPLHSLDGSQEHGDFPSFEVTEAAIRETLDTGLFTSRGSNRMGWAHQGYAEFLAAEYLEAKGIPAATMLKLIMHPSGGLVPQLGVVTAWIASIDKNVRQKLIQLDPMILMQGDLTGLGDSDLENLVSSLMTALDEGRTHDFTSGPFSVGVWAFYDKLNHPGLADQLRPYINDPNKNVVSRQTAISVAKRCRLRELQPDLLKLALDTTSDAHLRGRAVDALGQCGDDTVPTKLLPLAMGELGDDPHDEMRGYALEIVWPAHLDTKTLFSLLRPPNESFYGSYVQFLTTTIPEKLAVEHLPIALDWCASLVDRHGSNGDFHRRSLADSVFILAWKHLDRAEIMKSLLAYVLALFRGFHDLFRGSGIREVEAFKEELANNPARRRLFLLAAARSGLGDTDAFHLRRAQLLRTVDLDWLLNLSPGSPGHDSTIDGHTLCTLIKSLADLNNAKHLDAIYETATKWSLLWQAFRYVFEGIPLGSLDAKQLRDSHKRTLEIESRVRPPIAPEPEKKVAEELKKFDEGDLNAWWRLNLFLALTPTARGFDSDFDFSIGKMRGWVNANDSTKLRILKAARRYLTDAENVAAKWVGKNPQPTYRSDMAAFRALILLKEFDQGSYQDIPAEVWKKWAPVCAGIAAIPRSGDDGSLERQVIADALKLAPAEFVGTIRGIMRAERQRVADGARESAPIRGSSFFVLRQLGGCWESQALKGGLLVELEDANNSEDQFASILDLLLDASFLPAKQIAMDYIRRGTSEPRAMSSAIGLTVHSPRDAWSEIWKLIVSDGSFGEAFFLEMGQRRVRESSFSGLNEEELAAVYVYLERKFPRQEETVASGPHWVGPRESIGHMRDSILQQIVATGTNASARAMQWVVGQLPELPWLSYHLLQAQHAMRTKTWSPLSPRELFQLLASRERTLVWSAEDLAELLIAALRRYEQELHGEQNPIRALWDRQGSGNLFRPVDEDAFSDTVRLFLKRELVDAGIVANREVEIARVPGARIGTRTDIRIDAVRQRPDGSHDIVTSVIESKGCWNKALFADLKDQLFSEYLARLRVPIGIYLVAWFDTPKWDPSDYRRNQVPNLTLQEAQERLEAEAASIPAGYSIEPVVIDCHAP